MIQYTLKCAEGHRFDSWFKSASAYDKLHKAGHVTCVFCGSSDVEKAMMAPRLNVKENSKAAPLGEHASEPTPTPPAPATTATPPQPVKPAQPVSLSEPGSELEQAIKKFKKHVEANSDYVGKNFAKEARAIQSGDAPERAIWGETKLEDAKALIEDGVPVTPLPFTPTRKTN